MTHLNMSIYVSINRIAANVRACEFETCTRFTVFPTLLACERGQITALCPLCTFLRPTVVCRETAMWSCNFKSALSWSSVLAYVLKGKGLVC